MASPAYQSSGMYGTPYAGSPGGMMTRRSVRMLCVSRAKKRACGRMASAYVDPSRGTITCDCMKIFSFHFPRTYSRPCSNVYLDSKEKRREMRKIYDSEPTGDCVP